MFSIYYKIFLKNSKTYFDVLRMLKGRIYYIIEYLLRNIKNRFFMTILFKKIKSCI